MSIEKSKDIIRVFKNDRAFPGLLLIKVNDEDTVASTKSIGNVTAMYNKKGELLGYNISQAEYPGRDGYLPMSEELLASVNGGLQAVGFEPLQHDFTPRIVVGHVIRMEDHPDSDHLHICQVDVGAEVLQIVCGAHNATPGIYVPAALNNAVMPNGRLIRDGKLRGAVSHGMLCSEWELGLVEEKQKGLLILDDTYQIGASFFAEREKHHV